MLAGVTISPPVPEIMPAIVFVEAPEVGLIVARAPLLIVKARVEASVIAPLILRVLLLLKVTPPFTPPRLVFAEMATVPALMTNPPEKVLVTELRVSVFVPVFTNVRTLAPLSFTGALIVIP